MKNGTKKSPKKEVPADGAIKKSVSLPVELWQRAEAKGGFSHVVQAALKSYLDGITDTDNAIAKLDVRLGTIERVLGELLAAKVPVASPMPTNIAHFPVQQRPTGTRPISVYGSIAAGDGDTVARENADDLLPFTLEVPAHVAQDASYALRVKGVSMNDAKPTPIFNGDTVLIAHRDPKEGDIIAALIDGKTTLKRFRMQAGEPVLISESTNPAFGSIIPFQSLLCGGVMVAKYAPHPED